MGLSVVGTGARVFWGVVIAGAVGAAGMTGYRMVESRITSEIYRQRLAGLAEDHRALAERYNEAVRKTAVTELLVERGALRVVVRTSEGVQEVIDTPFDPSGEIYVDYVVIGGRLLIRRVFDEKTSPSRALVIDGALGDVDWSDPRVGVGKAVYRRLGEGRWVVTVTGDGSLGLARRDDPRPGVVTMAPEVRDYEELEREVAGEVERIRLRDVWRFVMAGDR